MAALSMRRLWLMYKRTILREGLGITRRRQSVSTRPEAVRGAGRLICRLADSAFLI